MREYRKAEAVKSGNEVMTGTFCDKIYNFASLLYYKMAKVQYIYGKGNSSLIISHIIQNFFQNKLKNLNEMNKLGYSLILSQYDNSIYQSNK